MQLEIQDLVVEVMVEMDYNLQLQEHQSIMLVVEEDVQLMALSVQEVLVEELMVIQMQPML